MLDSRLIAAFRFHRSRRLGAAGTPFRAFRALEIARSDIRRVAADMAAGDHKRAAAGRRIADRSPWAITRADFSRI